MMYIATFFNHYNAVKFSRELREAGIEHDVMPVPRKLSSSCGSCVRFSTEGDPLRFVDDGVEKIVEVQEAHTLWYMNAKNRHWLPQLAQEKPGETPAFLIVSTKMIDIL